MGTIVNLPSPRRKRRADPQPKNEATILLFMGVRYVREFEPGLETPPSVATLQPAALELA